MDTAQLLTNPAPPEILLMSDDAEKKAPPTNTPSSTGSGSAVTDKSSVPAMVEPSGTSENRTADVALGGSTVGDANSGVGASSEGNTSSGIDTGGGVNTGDGVDTGGVNTGCGVDSSSGVDAGGGVEGVKQGDEPQAVVGGLETVSNSVAHPPVNPDQVSLTEECYCTCLSLHNLACTVSI